MTVFTEDFTEFFGTSSDLGDFSTPGTYTPTVGSAITVVGIFDKEGVFDPGGSEAPTQGNKPRFHVDRASVPNQSAAAGDTLLIGSTTYNVVGELADETDNMLALELEEV